MTRPEDAIQRSKFNAKKMWLCEDCGGATHVPNPPPPPCAWCGGKPVLFDSLGEAKRYAGLIACQKRGEIRNLKRQPKFPLAIDGKPILIRSERYKNGQQAVITLDFQYEERQGSLHTRYNDEWVTVVEDWKGYDTTESRLRRAVFEAQYGKRVKVTGAQKRRR